MENPLLSLMGFQGPSNDNQLLDMAVGEWPPRWWKRVMRQEEPPTLPVVRVSGIQSRAQQLRQQDEALRASDLRYGVAPNIAQPVQTPQYYRQRAQAEYQDHRAQTEQEQRRYREHMRVTEQIRARVNTSMQHILGSTAKVYSVPNVMRDLRPGTNFLGHTSGATFGTRVLLGQGDTTPLPHELGHVLENTNFDPQLLQQLQTARTQYLALPDSIRGIDYYPGKRGEYVASVFGDAASLIRSTADGADVTTEQSWINDADRQLPGVRAAYNWMLQQPEFSWHPLAHLQTLPAITVRHP